MSPRGIFNKTHLLSLPQRLDHVSHLASRCKPNTRNPIPPKKTIKIKREMIRKPSTCGRKRERVVAREFYLKNPTPPGAAQATYLGSGNRGGEREWFIQEQEQTKPHPPNTKGNAGRTRKPQPAKSSSREKGGGQQGLHESLHCGEANPNQGRDLCIQRTQPHREPPRRPDWAPHSLYKRENEHL